MGNSGYLTIEETAGKLGRSVSWVKEQICEGKLGATLSGRQWLITSQEFDELLRNNMPAHGTQKLVRNFLSDRPKRKTHGTQNDRNAPNSTWGREPIERSRKSLPSAGNRPPEKSTGPGPTLTQKIEELDREFEHQTARLKTAMLQYRAAAGTGKKVKPPSTLIHQWRTTKAELQYLIARAEAKGLILPAGLTIHRILAQETETVKRNTASVDGGAPKKTATTMKGIEGYSAGSGRRNPQDTRKVPAHVEARLIVLRNRQRMAAHSMQDRGKSRAAREAAAITWAETRREAEKLERQFGVTRGSV